MQTEDPMSNDMAMHLEIIRYGVTLVLPPLIFATVLLGFLGVRKLVQVVWP
jgi:hypothetical protein